MQRYEHRTLNAVACQAKAGDSAAQTRLLKMLEPLIASYAFKVNLPGMDTDDLKQDIRLAILEKLAFYDPQRDLLPYVLPIIRTVIGTILRSLGTQKRDGVTVPLTGKEAGKLTVSQSSIVTRIVEVGTENEILVAMLFGDGHTRAEVSDLTGLTDWAVRAALNSLRRKLSDDLGEGRAKRHRAKRATSAATPEGGGPLRWGAGE